MGKRLYVVIGARAWTGHPRHRQLLNRKVEVIKPSKNNLSIPTLLWSIPIRLQPHWYEVWLFQHVGKFVGAFIDAYFGGAQGPDAGAHIHGIRILLGDISVEQLIGSGVINFNGVIHGTVH